MPSITPPQSLRQGDYSGFLSHSNGPDDFIQRYYTFGEVLNHFILQEAPNAKYLFSKHVAGRSFVTNDLATSKLILRSFPVEEPWTPTQVVLDNIDNPIAWANGVKALDFGRLQQLITAKNQKLLNTQWLTYNPSTRSYALVDVKVNDSGDFVPVYGDPNPEATDNSPDWYLVPYTVQIFTPLSAIQRDIDENHGRNLLGNTFLIAHGGDNGAVVRRTYLSDPDPLPYPDSDNMVYVDIPIIPGTFPAMQSTTNTGTTVWSQGMSPIGLEPDLTEIPGSSFYVNQLTKADLDHIADHHVAHRWAKGYSDDSYYSCRLMVDPLGGNESGMIEPNGGYNIVDTRGVVVPQADRVERFIQTMLRVKIFDVLVPINEDIIDRSAEMSALFNDVRDERIEQIHMQRRLLKEFSKVAYVLQRNPNTFDTGNIDLGQWTLTDTAITGNVDTTAFTWRNINQDITMIFAKPYYRDVNTINNPPIEKSKTPEAALNFTVQNRSPVLITKQLSRSVVVEDHVVTSNVQTSNWNVSAGISIEAGYQSQLSGVTALATASVNGGYSNTKETSAQSGNSTSTTKYFQDTLAFDAMSQYQIVAYYDKSEIERTFTVEGVCDWEVTFKTGNLGAGTNLPVNSSVTENSWKDFISKLTGAYDVVSSFYKTDPIYRWEVVNNRTPVSKVLNVESAIIDTLANTYARTIRFDGSMTYTDSGDISLDVRKTGSWTFNGNADPVNQWTLNTQRI